MKKLFILFLTLVMVAGISTLTLAQTEFGFLQNFQGRNLVRVDLNNVLFAVPLKDNLDQFKLGLKLGTPIGNLYGVGKLVSQYNWDAEQFDPMRVNVGFGYPVHWKNVTFRGELMAQSPRWSKPDTWSFSALLGIQFNFEQILVTE